MIRRRSFLFALCILFAMFFVAKPGWAQDGVFLKNTDDLSVTYVSQWVGGSHGGYLPIRIRVVNSGPSRELTFRLKPRGRDKLPIVQKTVRVDRNATRLFTLPVPLVGNGSMAMLQVLDADKKEIEDLEERIPLPGIVGNNPTTPAILIIAESTVDCSAITNALQALSMQSTGSSPSRRTRTVRLDHRTVSPAYLPDSWIDYTTVDIVAAEFLVLSRLSKGQLSAIRKLVQCGGMLLVRNLGEAPATSEKLNQLLQLDTRSNVASRWKFADLATRKKVSRFPIAAQQPTAGRTQRGPGGRVVPMPSPSPRRNPRSPSRILNHFSWPSSPRAFSHRSEMLGTIVAFSNDPFQGTTRDWMWFLETLKPERYSWIARHGMSARRETGEQFLQFLIPGVKGVPVYAFLFLMTVFTIIIGPVNYFVLWKRKRLFLLVLTIPVIAFVTSLSLFGYSVVSHGFEIKSRTRSLTILDQRTKNAVTTSRIALFAGMAPSDGLNFSPDTAVYPIWPADKNFEAGTIDWTDSQVLKSGWLRSRTRTQFLTITHRQERARLEIDPPQNGKMKVINGFTVEMEALIVVDEQGNLYHGTNLSAGDAADLSTPETDDLKKFVTALRRHTPELPDGVTKYTNRGMFNFRRRHRGRFQEQNPANFSNSHMERAIASLQKLWPEKTKMRSRTYIAILKSDPRAELGVKDTHAYAGVHILIGFY